MQETTNKRDTLLHSVLSCDPSKLYKAVSSNQQSGNPTLHNLQVGDRTS